MDKQFSALQVAKYFVEKASSVDENDLTNLKLQKLLYFAQSYFLKNKGKALFSEPIEAWEFGPVVRSVYETFKVCGAFPITGFDVKFEADSLPKEVTNELDKVWVAYFKYSANHLVTMTHRTGSAWRQTREKSQNSSIIPNELIARTEV